MGCANWSMPPRIPYRRSRGGLSGGPDPDDIFKSIMTAMALLVGALFVAALFLFFFGG
jgi:hypothetical protein